VDNLLVGPLDAGAYDLGEADEAPSPQSAESGGRARRAPEEDLAEPFGVTGALEGAGQGPHAGLGAVGT
jgi:hypothetical protein